MKHDKSIKVIRCHKLNFLYVPTPKCACTSLKHWIYRIEFGQEFENYQVDNKWIHIHNCGKLDQFLLSQLSNQERHSKLIALVRDPIMRLISAYSNRVFHYKELSENMPYSNKISSLGLQFNPDINYFVRHLESYQECTNIIYHHTRPCADFIGKEISLYDRIYRMDELKHLRTKILQYNANADINQENIPAIPKLQTGGPKLELNVLHPASFEKLLAYYAQDYQVLKDYYSISGIKELYQLSCSQKKALLNREWIC